MSDVTVFELKKVDLRGATIIDGFPSVGLVSSIAANYLIKLLDLEQVGVMDSMDFPTVSLVRDGVPMNPVRIYAGEKGNDGAKQKIAVFISEFQPPPPLIKPIARTMMDWAQDQRCSMLVSPEGLVIDRSDEPEQKEEFRDSAVYGLGSNERAMKRLLNVGVEPFSDGVITGVAGVLLNEGRMRDYEVLTILAEASSEYPDARAAATVVGVIGRLIAELEIDPKPLHDEAEKMEEQLKKIQEKARLSARAEKIVTRPQMYG